MLNWVAMPPPTAIVCAGQQLFDSFFPPEHQRRLGRVCRWERDDARTFTPALKRRLAHTQALITTWDSPYFSEDLPKVAPQLRFIGHCGGEVKSRFARPLFETLTIANAAGPMASATAELGAAFLLYCTRNVDFYRDSLRRRSNRIYEQLHLRGASESIVGQEIAMIGFGRIGRALVGMLRGFDLRWVVYDPYAPKSLAKQYPVQFTTLRELLPRAHFLVLTAALTDETRQMLNGKRLACLPDGAVIINIARGGLVDLAALTKAVKRKRLRCALDVTDPLEPLPIGHPLRKLPGAIVTPHIAGSNQQVRHEIATVVMDELERFFKGLEVQNRVTTAMLDRMT